MLRKELRLKRNKDFSYLYRKGIKLKGKYISIYKLRSSSEMKIGFSLSKKIGNAVVRNLYRRRLQEIFREEIGNLAPSKYVVVAFPNIKESSFKDLKEDVLNLIEKMSI